MTALLPLSALRRLRAEEPPGVPAESCDRCGAALAAEHAHLADLGTRTLRCVCPGCHAAVAAEGEGPGGRRAVGRRYLRLPSAAIGGTDWDALEIPVGIAFFFHNSTLGRTVACYPSPAGAIESLLPPERWERVLAANRWTRTLQADVEALLVRRTHDADESFIVPVDACYELAGRIRRRWSGFGGGAGAREEIEGFFHALRERSRPVSP